MGQPTFRLNQWAERVEKPPMAVQFLLVLFLEAKDDLNRAGVHGSLSSGGTNNTGGVLENVRGYCLAIDGVFGNPFLVTAHLSGISNTDAGVRVFLDVPG